MLAKLLTLIALAGMATAAVLPRDTCNNQVYRCSSDRTAIEVCDASGWRLQSLCGAPTCAYDPVQGVPHCY